MATIEFPIAGGVTLIDQEDFVTASLFNWWIWTRRTPHIEIPYVCSRVLRPHGNATLRLHRLLMRPRADETVDHINGNTLDNRRANLRICSHKENVRNRSPYTYRSLPKGVYKTQRGRPYAARIKFNGTMFELGRFDTPEDAAQAYDVAAVEKFGEFARPNSSL